MRRPVEQVLTNKSRQINTAIMTRWAKPESEVNELINRNDRSVNAA